MPGDRLRASAGDARRRRVDPVTRAANIRSVHTDDSTQARSRGSRVWHACVAVAGTDALGISPPSVLVFTDQPSCPPSLGAALLSALLVRPRSTLGRGSPPGISRTGVSAMSALGRPVANLHYYAGSDSCQRSPAPTGLPAYLASPSRRSTPNHVMPPVDRFTRRSTASTVSFRLRHLPAGSPRHPAETGSLSCRPTVRLTVAPHPASRRRSYLRLRSFGLLRHGLAPC
jgi:hypothetical protein